ncbi:MAG: DUF3108 domain-containing protein [Bacteroidetes bacterium]|nr:DUF3108 domain-containing protein [Bacteroidota bacterium]
MKTINKLLKLVLMLSLIFISTTQAQELRSIQNNAFKKGEVITYRVHYGIIDAGIARLEVLDEEKKYGNRDAFHIVGTGKSRGAFDWFFKVRDRYETFIDAEAIVPWVFLRRVDEGGYKINQNYVFNPFQNKVIADGKHFETPDNVQDMLSSFYYSRCIDYSKAKEGDIFTIPSFVDNEIFEMKIKYIGKETIETDLGVFKCLKFRPVVQKGRVFKKEEDLNVWITDDANHIPVRAQAEILVGSIKMDLQSYSGLASPISKISD